MNGNTLIVILSVVLASSAARFLPGTKARQWVLLIGSYIMYGTLAGAAFLMLLAVSSLMNYGWGQVLRRRPTTARLWAAIGANVLLLAFFKYLPPLVGIWGGAFPELDFVQRIVMPLGISFWTFQALSYLLDTYLEVETDPSMVEFFLFMAFWPTVASGPVCRLPRMLPQFRKASVSVREDFSIGLVRLTQGLFMKLVLADLLATGMTSGGGVTAGFDAIGVEPGGLDVWILGIGFGFQMFFDFAGYSHMVIGAARLVGIRLEENFNRPYLATTPAVFWTRWHMSLSSWIRDYVYLPLSALRRARWWSYAALVISMALFGIWHNASLTMLVWGCFHGLVLVGYRAGRQLGQRVPYRLPTPVGGVLSWGVTFMLVCMGHVIFRANNVGQALRMLGTVLTPGSYGFGQVTVDRDDYILVGLMALGYFAFVGISELLRRWSAFCGRGQDSRPSLALGRSAAPGITIGTVILATPEFVTSRRWWILIPALTLLLAIVAMKVGGGDETTIAPFVYTQF